LLFLPMFTGHPTSGGPAPSPTLKSPMALLHRKPWRSWLDDMSDDLNKWWETR
jgi:hypothetical protein